MRSVILLLGVAGAGVLLVAAGCSSLGRKLTFYPSHRPGDGGLAPWIKDGRVIGFSRAVTAPTNVWLMMHGNAGQAADRAYAIPSFSGNDSVFILEYPGYGQREGVPSRATIDPAAIEAYQELRNAYPGVPVCVAAESLGSGPACLLTGLAQPPDKVVLIVPFEKFSAVARDHYPAFLVSLLLKDDWDNVKALSTYRGPVDIFGAQADTVIPVIHARALAAGAPTAKFILLEGGHNDWAQPGRVRIRNP